MDKEGSFDREEVIGPKKRKRGVRNSENYTRNVIKQSRLREKEYLIYKEKKRKLQKGKLERPVGKVFAKILEV